MRPGWPLARTPWKKARRRLLRPAQPRAGCVTERTHFGPPGSGKDSFAGDVVAQESAEGRKRVAWVMESEKFSRRRFERLAPLFSNPRAYVQPQGPDTTKPTRTLIDASAPMAWSPATWMFTGRAPMAQPPGNDTSADPNRATSGPSTRIDARMVFTSS